MAVSSARKIQIQFTEDFRAGYEFNAAVNENAAAVNTITNLASGNNTITVPSAGTVPTSVTIIPPAGNEVVITLKGVNGDTGIALHLTDPTSLALPSSVTTFVLNASDALEGLRLFWT